MNPWWTVLLVAVLACGGGSAAPGQKANVPHEIAGRTLYLPPGFAVGLFAADVAGARSLALGPGGVVYVAQQGRGIILRLRDLDADGVAEQREVVMTGLDNPFGMAFRGETLYFAEQHAVRRAVPGVTAPDVLISGLPRGGHRTRTIVFGADGMLYLAVGSSCNVCDERDSLRAAIMRYAPDGSQGRRFATGLRNSVGLAVHPTTGALWATNNDRDNIGPTVSRTDELPPDRVNIIRDGGWYGWPRCYLPGAPNPEYPDADCRSAEPPAITFQAHTAPLGIRFYTGNAFPAEYRGDAFVALHGSWNRSVPVGAKVVRVRVEAGQPTGVEDFVTGWQLASGRRWGRPVDVLPLPDGSLLISDDDGDRVWRVSYAR
jgi:glucose/arabinose dehydrogenase